MTQTHTNTQTLTTQKLMYLTLRPGHKEWCQKIKQMFSTLKEYVANNHKKGVTWNPNVSVMYTLHSYSSYAV